MRRALIAAFAVVVVALLAFYVASPYYAFHELTRAAKTGDRDGLADAVDFPAVREDFKAQLNAALLAKMGGDAGLKNNPLAAIGMLIAPAIVDRMIDVVITPDGIAQMVTEAHMPRPGQTARPQGDNPHVSTHSAYASLDRFKVTAVDDAKPTESLVFVMERRGLFGWKLVRIELPPAALASGA